MNVLSMQTLVLSLFLALASAPASNAGEVVTLCNGDPNGIVDGAEQCESGPCCSPTCELLPAGTVCHEQTHPVCDPARTCGEQVFSAVAGCPDILPSVTIGTPCDDGLFCTVDDTCNGASCSGVPTDCDDANPCTDDACNEFDDECTYLNNSATCDDGEFCNGADSCQSGECSVHAGDPCDGADGDGNCAESCDEEAGNCEGADENGSACSDGLVCTEGDLCAEGMCNGGSPVDECTEPTTTTTEAPVTTTTLVEVTTTTLVDVTTTTLPDVTTTTLPDVTTTTLVEETCTLCGDITCDDKLTARDAYLILRAAVSLPTSCTLHVCDFTGDGEILSSDALAVLRAAVGLPSDPMCPPLDVDVHGEGGAALLEDLA